MKAVGWSLDHQGVATRPGGAAEVAALSPSKAPSQGLEVPKAGAVLGSPGQALSQVLCPRREQEGPEVRTCPSTRRQLLPVHNHHIHNLAAPCVPSSTLLTRGLAGRSHDIHAGKY